MPLMSGVWSGDLGVGKTFDQVLLSAPVGAVELRVGAVVDDHVRVEVLPADGVRDARLALDHHVRRVEELSHHLQQFPESNPNPVIRAAVDGRVLCANPAATDCMANSGWFLSTCRRFVRPARSRSAQGF